MLLSLEDLYGVSVAAADGEIGKINNFLFDDQSWRIRYFAVDVGGWLARRDVVISVSAADRPDWENKTIRVHLTKDLVRHSPDVDSQRPVSRQQEIAMNQHYGWPAYWLNAGYAELPPVGIPTGVKLPARSQDDPHLRSSVALTGYQVWAEDNAVGRLENFIVDEDSWHIGYLDVRMGDWLHGRSMLVPTCWVTSVSWANYRVNLCQVREAV